MEKYTFGIVILMVERITAKYPERVERLVMFKNKGSDVGSKVSICVTKLQVVHLLLGRDSILL